MPSIIGNTGKPLGVREAREIRDDLIAAYLTYGDLADQALTHVTSRIAEPALIWSTMTEIEAGILADLAIARGRTSPLVASAVRSFMLASNYVKAGYIVGPRAWATIQRIAENGGLSL